MQYIIKGYQPEWLFTYFEEISAIPRSSGNEKKISDFVMNFAKYRDLEVYQDEIWNVVIKKSGSPGCENLPPVMLQGHLDMVCEKNAATRHDFLQDGLRLVVEQGKLRADGTTLGADNGIAVALVLAILEDDSLIHPPLECVFTVQEETGLAGAAEIDPALLVARTMINLDSEEEGIATVSCAGGMTVHLGANGSRLVFKGGKEAVKIRMGGLLGGHSGADIHLERGNAILLMGRLLAAAGVGHKLSLSSLQGGNKDNAIPRECEAVICVDIAAERDAILGTVQAEAEAIRQELVAWEPDVWVAVEPVMAGDGLETALTDKIIALLTLAPNGVLNRNIQAGGFTVCSSNLGVIRIDQNAAEIVFSLRSSVDSLQKHTKRQLERLANLLDFTFEVKSEYPGWAYAARSPIRDLFCECYQQQSGQALKCEAIHAGLECGLFSGKLPGLDAIAVGPQIDYCHTPDEVLDLASCERTYQLLCAVLKGLAVQ